VAIESDATRMKVPDVADLRGIRSQAHLRLGPNARRPFDSPSSGEQYQ
jgi:hypothetical protein